MAQLIVIRDPQIEKPEFILPYRTPQTGEDTDGTGMVTEVQQTNVIGVLMPLFIINNIAIASADILQFGLDYTGTVPEIQFAIRDRNNILTKFANPGNDNELRIQIIPPVDNTYKKIDMNFVCTDVQIQSNIVFGRASFLLKDFTQSRLKALGQISTYELFDEISTETGLGFVSNAESTEDTRYIQCQYESYKDVVDREISKSGSDDVHVYDWWVDLWNNLVLCNLYDRVSSEDSEEDMKVWITVNSNNASKQEENEVIKDTAYFTNMPGLERTSMYVRSFDVETNIAPPSSGNTVLLSVYEENKKEYVDHYIADGDIQKNDFIKFEYAGEVYGDYNYLIAEKCRDIYLAKVKSEIIVIQTNVPQLGINRGDQVRFVWYDNDSDYAYMQDQLEELGAVATSTELQSVLGWVTDWQIEQKNPLNSLRINLQYSGQYTCIGQRIAWSAQTKSWECYLYLTRPADKRAIIMNDLEESNKTTTQV